MPKGQGWQRHKRPEIAKKFNSQSISAERNSHQDWWSLMPGREEMCQTDLVREAGPVANHQVLAQYKGL